MENHLIAVHSDFIYSLFNFWLKSESQTGGADLEYCQVPRGALIWIVKQTHQARLGKT